MSLAILFHFLRAQHVSDINISIIRNLRLFCWITTLVVFFLVRCVLEFRCGWVGLVSVLQAASASQYSQYSHSLWAGRSGDRVPVEARFSIPNQPPIQWLPGISRGVKQPGRGVDHLPLSSAEAQESVELELLPLWAFVSCSTVSFKLLIFFTCLYKNN